MAIKLMTEVFELQIKPASHKLLLLALADAADPIDGVTWIPVKSRRHKMDLLTKTSLSERALQGAIAALVRDGYLVRYENPGKGCAFVVRSVPVNNPETDLFHTPANSAGVSPVIPKTPANSAGGPANSAGKPSINRHLEIKGGGLGEPVDKCRVSGKALPPGVAGWQWDAYLQMREDMNKPVSVGVAVILLSKLEAIGDAGWYLGDVVEKGIVCGWPDFHEPPSGRPSGIRKGWKGQAGKPVGATDADMVKLAEIEALDRLDKRLAARAEFFASVDRRGGSAHIAQIVANLPFEAGGKS